jgi:hypothetical protein
MRDHQVTVGGEGSLTAESATARGRSAMSTPSAARIVMSWRTLTTAGFASMSAMRA